MYSRSYNLPENPVLQNRHLFMDHPDSILGLWIPYPTTPAVPVPSYDFSGNNNTLGATNKDKSVSFNWTYRYTNEFYSSMSTLGDNYLESKHTGDFGFDGDSEFTILLWCYKGDGGDIGTQPGLLSYLNLEGTDTGWSLRQSDVNPNDMQFYFVDTLGAGHKVEFPGGWIGTRNAVFDDVHFIALTRHKGGDYELYKDMFDNDYPFDQRVNVIQATDSADLGTAVGQILRLGVRSANHPGDAVEGYYTFLGIFNRALEDGEISSWFYDPFECFRPTPFDVPGTYTISEEKLISLEEATDEVNNRVDSMMYNLDPDRYPSFTKDEGNPFDGLQTPGNPLTTTREFLKSLLYCYWGTSNTYYLELANDLIYRYIQKCTVPFTGSLYGAEGDFYSWPGNQNYYGSYLTSRLVEIGFAQGALMVLSEDFYQHPQRNYMIDFIKHNCVDKWSHASHPFTVGHMLFTSYILLHYLGKTLPAYPGPNPSFKFNMWPRFQSAHGFFPETFKTPEETLTYRDMAENWKSLLFDTHAPDIKIGGSTDYPLTNDTRTIRGYGDGGQEGSSAKSPFDACGCWKTVGGRSYRTAGYFYYPGDPDDWEAFTKGYALVSDLGHIQYMLHCSWLCNHYIPGFLEQEYVDILRWTAMNRIYRGTNQNPHAWSEDCNYSISQSHRIARVITGTSSAIDDNMMRTFLTTWLKTDEFLDNPASPWYANLYNMNTYNEGLLFWCWSYALFLAGPYLTSSKTALSKDKPHGSAISNDTFYLQNHRYDSVSYTITPSSNVSVFPANGTLVSGEKDEITISYPSGLEAGTYNEILTITAEKS